MEAIFKALAQPFDPIELEYRISRCGKTKSNRGESIWAKCLTFVQNRAIMNRLDSVVGPSNWQNQFREFSGGVLCGISIRETALFSEERPDDDRWITKWDGAPPTEFEAFKGGISDSMKRAAVHWGVGRYLYNLPESFAIVRESGRYFGVTKDKTRFNWDPPQLPDWALPGGAGEGDAPGAVTSGQLLLALQAGADASPDNQMLSAFFKRTTELMGLLGEDDRAEYLNHIRELKELHQNEKAKG